MKKFALTILFVVCCLLLVDRVGGDSMLYCTQHTCAHAERKITHLVKWANEDVILLGTSRCDNHYVPSIISDSLGMTVYNGGISSSENVYSHYIVLNYLLEHHTPKVICLELMDHDFLKSGGSFSFTSFFAPYCGLSEKADSIFREAGTYNYYKLSHLYRFNSKACETIYGMIVRKNYSIDNGYYANPKPSKAISKLDKQSTVRKDEYDEKKLQYIQKFIDTCKKKNIKLVFTISPRYTIVDNGFYNPLYDIAERNNIPFLDYHTAGLFHNMPENFSNPGHLWDKGAREYSSIFAADLKAIMKNMND